MPKDLVIPTFYHYSPIWFAINCKYIYSSEHLQEEGRKYFANLAKQEPMDEDVIVDEDVFEPDEGHIMFWYGIFLVVTILVYMKLLDF